MNLLSITWDFDPIFFSVLGIEIAYYGLMFVVAFILGEFVFRKMVRREGLREELVYSAFLYCMIAVVVGARLGHCLFYDFSYYVLDPFMDSFPYIKILNIRGGGLASHGAAIGMVVGIFMWTKRNKIPPIWMFDRVGIVIAIGGAFIRLGNLFNSEIYGHETSLPWGFIFVRDGGTVPMHPTQIYEALLYLLTAAVLLHIYYRTKWSDKRGVMFGIFLIMLFGARLLVESIKLVQEPWETDMVSAIGLNMGQVLSIPFIVAGVVILWRALKRPAQPYTNMPKATKETSRKKK